MKRLLERTPLPSKQRDLSPLQHGNCDIIISCHEIEGMALRTCLSFLLVWHNPRMCCGINPYVATTESFERNIGMTCAVTIYYFRDIKSLCNDIKSLCSNNSNKYPYDQLTTRLDRSILIRFFPNLWRVTLHLSHPIVIS